MHAGESRDGIPKPYMIPIECEAAMLPALRVAVRVVEMTWSRSTVQYQAQRFSQHWNSEAISMLQEDSCRTCHRNCF